MKNSLEVSKKRIKHLQKSLTHGYFFEDYYDLYYLTNLKLSRGLLFITNSSATLFVDGRYKEVATKNFAFDCKNLGDQEIEETLEMNQTVGFDAGNVSYSRYKHLKKICRKKQVNIKEAKNPLIQMRCIKEPHEINALQKSSDLLQKALAFAKTKLKPGVSELEVAKAFELYALKNGAQGLSFETIVAFSENSAMPHYRPGNRKLKQNDFVLIDAGVYVDSYASDITRVFLRSSKNAEIQRIYKIIREIHTEVLKQIRPGARLRDLGRLVEKRTEKAGYEVVHSLGHGVGLEVHEAPRIFAGAKKDLILEENMVITIEPGIYLPGLGGVRYEDMICVTKTGYKNFYKKI